MDEVSERELRGVWLAAFCAMIVSDGHVPTAAAETADTAVDLFKQRFNKPPTTR